MPSLEELSPEQRAIIELIVGRGQSYEDLSSLLGMPTRRVRELARDALTDLSPATSRRVDPEWRGQLADYLLGQQSGPESTATRGHLKRSEAARVWALSLLDSLDALYADGDRPTIPEREAAPRREREPGRSPLSGVLGSAPGTLLRERRDGGRPALSPEARAVVLRRRLLAGALAALLVLLAVLVWPIGLLTGDDEESRPAAARTPASAAKATGAAVVASQGNRRTLVVQARGLPVNRVQGSGSNRRLEDAYEVWLYNSPGDAVGVGAQITDRQGNFQGAGALPRNYRRYRFIDVSHEPVDDNARHSGRSVLRGEFPRLRSTSGSRQTKVLGQVRLRPVR